jgi:RNA polymerase sigma-70 factor, ECF subfamily
LESTRHLVESAVSGDPRSIELLLAQYLPRLRAFVRLRCGPEIRARESSSDIAQSVCRELLGQLGDFSWQGEPAFRSWLFTAALRKIADRQEHYLAAKRDARREVGPDAAADASVWEVYRSISTPSQHAIAREEAQRIEAAIEGLDPEAREVVVLAKIVGLTRAEIAGRLGKSETAVASILHRALARLAGHMLDS